LPIGSAAGILMFGWVRKTNQSFIFL